MLAWIGAVVIGVSLGLLGSGGAILTVPILVYLVGHGEKQSITESLAIVGLISLTGALRRLPDRRVDFRSVLYFGVPGMAGAYLGALASQWVSGAAQLVVLAGIMLAASVVMGRGGAKESDAPARKQHPGVLGAQGLFVGCVTGFVGVGGGFLIVPALVLLGGLPMHTAVGTSLAIIFINCASGFGKSIAVLHEQGMDVQWRTIAIFAGLGIVGSVLGASLGKRMDHRTLRRVFAVFLVVMAGYIVWRQWPKVFGPGAPAPVQPERPPESGTVLAPRASEVLAAGTL